MNAMRRMHLPGPQGPGRGRLSRAARECRDRLEHTRLHNRVGAYVDGELTGRQRLRMAAHLAACFACSGTAETLRLIKHSLRTRPQRAPVDLAEARLRRDADRLMRTDPTPPAR